MIYKIHYCGLYVLELVGKYLIMYAGYRPSGKIEFLRIVDTIDINVNNIILRLYYRFKSLPVTS